jgi:hypothetical protein
MQNLSSRFCSTQTDRQTDGQTVCATAYRVARAMGFLNNFNEEMKVQGMAAESLSLSRDHGMNPNNVGAFLNMMDKVATENNLSDTLLNIFNIDKSGKQNK